MAPLVDKWLGPVLDLITPARCRLCSTPIGANAVLCVECHESLPWNRLACPGCASPVAVAGPCSTCLVRPRRFDTAWTAFLHAAPVRNELHGLKYRARFDLARVLGCLMAGALAARPEPLPQLIIPVPLHRRRLMRRGYNQALEIGRFIAPRLAVELDPHAAERRLATAPQVRQASAAQRQRNLRGAFRVRRNLQGMHIALLDDVMTTGATLEALAHAARQAGAARIEAWAVTREP
jgi:ComF family protein